MEEIYSNAKNKVNARELKVANDNTMLLTLNNLQ